MRPSKSANLYGLVLAGGQSSRMGKNKSELEYHGIPQKEYAFGLLKDLCDKVFTSINKNIQPSEFKNPLIDEFLLESPLNGILSAFHHYPDQAWLTLPVDMPFVDHSTLALLVSERNERKVATCFLDSEGSRPEPLLTIWEPRAYQLLIGFYERGGISPREFLMTSDVCLLEVPNKKVLQNINTQEEFDAFKDSMANS